ncbi:MAG: hypothetical protein EBZ48_13400, partial [Proteobacteria bacterium]|nr:hypothetical protein [Pseudomonadota bacterium]
MFSYGLLLVMAFVSLAYLRLYYRSVSSFWFHPGWTTDDALQQVFPFHEVHYPHIFEGDLITTMMKCYLAPLHYWMGMGITVLTKNPIMTAHWMTLVQVVLSLIFLALALREKGGWIPALFGVTWLVHTRNIMQRLTGGLPRGWAEVVFTAYLYLAFTNRQYGVLCLLTIGCLLHPPATLLVGICHGLFLVWKFACPASRAEYRRPLLVYILFSPLLAVLTLTVTRMPPEIGAMADFATASQMPEFQVPKGRFPFLPLKSPWTEIRSNGFQAFVTRLYNPGPFWKEWTPTIVMIALIGILLLGRYKKREVVPTQLIFFLIASVTVYFLSRILAFKLYVPDRHIQFPFATFFIFAFTLGFWRAFLPGRGELRANEYRSTDLRRVYGGALGLLFVGLLVYAGSGLNLNGTANFNYPLSKRGGVFAWLRDNTPERSLIAGEPTLSDPTQLFAIRRAFISTETNHPFFDRYYAETRRRMEVVLRAHYAPSWKEFMA